MITRFAAAVAVGFGAGVGVTLLVQDGGNAAGTERARAADAGRRSAARISGRASEADVVLLEKKLEAAHAENATLRRRLEHFEAGPAPAVAETTERDANRSGPRFVHADAEKGLRAVDWKVTGESLATLLPLLSEAGAVARGQKEMRTELWGEIMASFGPIITQAIKLETNGVPWEHPFALANLVHATLAEAGEPLSEQQESDLDRIGLRFVDAHTRRHAGYGDDTLDLRKKLDSANFQDRFYAELEPLLTPAQQAVLYPPGVRGIRGLDVFAGSAAWDEDYDGLPHAGRAQLRAKAVARFMKDLGLRPELREAVAPLVAEWEAGYADAFLFAQPAPERLADKNMESSARILVAATRQVALYEAMRERLPLTEDERQRIVDHEFVLVPLLVK